MIIAEGEELFISDDGERYRLCRELRSGVTC